MAEDRRWVKAVGEENGWQSRSLGQMMRGGETGTAEAKSKGRKLCGQ